MAMPKYPERYIGSDILKVRAGGLNLNLKGASVTNILLGIVYLILGILCIYYLFFLGFGAHGTRFFLIWGVFGIMFFSLAAIRITGIRLPDVPVRIFRIAILLLAILFVFVEILIISRFTVTTDEGADYVIVAGAQVNGVHPSVVLQYRLDAAADYLLKYPDVICVVTGGQGYNEVVTEASVMADYLEAKGVQRERIILEDRSTNTAENMRFARRLIEERESRKNAGQGEMTKSNDNTDLADIRVAIVTNNFHLYRSMWIARREGITDITGIAAGSTLPYLPNNLLREFCGMCKDFIVNVIF